MPNPSWTKGVITKLPPEFLQYRNCAICSPETRKFLPGYLIAVLKDGSKKDIPVISDKLATDNYIYVIIDGEYQGGWELYSDQELLH